MRRKDEKPPDDSVADEVLQTLTRTIQERTEAERDRVNAERDRERELQTLHGDIQAVALGIGEMVGKMDEINHRLTTIDKRLHDLGKDLRDDMRKSRNVSLQMSELLSRSLREWTNAVQIAEAAGVDVPKPPGYELGNGE